MEWGQQMKIQQNNSKLAMFHNTSYNNERLEQKRVIIDVNMSISGTKDCGQKNENSKQGLTSFKLELCEPLIIDTLSDIYLESFMTWNGLKCDSASGSGMAYVLKIKEFCNNDTNYATNIYTNTLIPNPNFDCSVSCSPQNVSHIVQTSYDCNKMESIIIPVLNSASNHYCSHMRNGEKYVTSINPTKLTELNGTITDDGILYNYTNALSANNTNNIEYKTAFNQGYGRFIATFIIKKRCYC